MNARVFSGIGFPLFFELFNLLSKFEFDFNSSEVPLLLVWIKGKIVSENLG